EGYLSKLKLENRYVITPASERKFHHRLQIRAKNVEKDINEVVKAFLSIVISKASLVGVVEYGVVKGVAILIFTSNNQIPSDAFRQMVEESGGELVSAELSDYPYYM